MYRRDEDLLDLKMCRRRILYMNILLHKCVMCFRVRYSEDSIESFILYSSFGLFKHAYCSLGYLPGLDAMCRSRTFKHNRMSEKSRLMRILTIIGGVIKLAGDL